MWKVLYLKNEYLLAMNLKNFILSLFLVFLTFSVSAEELEVTNQNTEFNVYTGMFDFSDDGKKSTLIGFQHQNENLNRDTFLGNLSPVTGALITADNAGYIYTGVQAQYKIGALNFTPSFTPGLYHEGDGKDLGHLIEFKKFYIITILNFFNFFSKCRRIRSKKSKYRIQCLYWDVWF